MNSMTGYGTSECVCHAGMASVQVRSLNSRFLDVSISLPPQLSCYEREINKMVSERFKRGKADVSVRITESACPQCAIDTKKALSCKDAILHLAEDLNLERPSDSKLLSMILSSDGVIGDNAMAKTNECGAQDWDAIKDAIEKALEECKADRSREGEMLKKDLANKLTVLEKCAAIFEEWMPCMEDRLKSMAVERFNSILKDNIDMNRVMQEVSVLMLRYTINEEVVRLKSHIAAIKTELDNPFPGKRLDFICQEAGREINTIGSKNPFADISAAVVDAKDALEAIREQARNVE